MTTKTELAGKLDEIGATINKVGTETRALLTRIDELSAALAAGDTLPVEAEDALRRLLDQAAAVDGLVPDAT